MKFDKKIFLSLLFLLISIVAVLVIFKPSKKYEYTNLTDNENLNENAYLLYNDYAIEQKFYTDFDVIDSIKIKVEYVDKCVNNYYDGDIFNSSNIPLNPYILLILKDKNGNIIVEKNVTLKQIQQNNEISIKMLDITDSKWDDFLIVIKANNLSKNSYFKIYNVDKTYFHISTSINDKIVKNTINYSIVGGKYDLTYLFFSIICLLDFVGIYISITCFNDKLKLSKKGNILFFLSEIIYSIIFIFSYIKLKTNINTHDYFSLIYAGILLLSQFIIVIQLFIGYKNWKKIYEKLFLLIVIPIGICYLISVLPNWVPDENQHYYKIYTMSTGTMKPVKNNIIPTQIVENSYQEIYNYNLLFEQIDRETNYNDVSIVKGRANLYNFILYLPAALTTMIGRCLDLNIFINYYFARIVNFLIVISICYFCIKLIPHGKLILLIYMLNPMFIHQAMSLSIDGIMNAISLFSISYILYLKNKKVDLKLSNFIILAILMILISMTKYVYFPLILLSLLLFPKIKNKGKILLILCIMIAITFMLIFYKYNLESPASSKSLATNDNSSYSEIFSVMIQNPIQCIYVFKNTINELGSYYIETFAGKHLGWLNISNSNFTIYLYLFILVFSCFRGNGENRNEEFNNWERIIITFIFLMSFSLIFFGFYLTYYERNLITIHGIQGRYFIPIVILPLLLINNKKYNYNRKTEFILLILLFVLHCNIIINICDFFL